MLLQFYKEGNLLWSASDIGTQLTAQEYQTREALYFGKARIPCNIAAKKGKAAKSASSRVVTYLCLVQERIIIFDNDPSYTSPKHDSVTLQKY